MSALGDVDFGFHPLPHHVKGIEMVSGAPLLIVISIKRVPGGYKKAGKYLL